MEFEWILAYSLPCKRFEVLALERGFVLHTFRSGETVVRREILRGEVWFGMATVCVADTDDVLVLYVPTGAEFGFPGEGRFPAGRHPWEGKRTHWEGNGKLMLQRPGDAYSLDLFWTGSDRTFAGWYFNLQDSFRRTPIGIDTLDHELDIWWPADAPKYEWKDVDLFEQRIREGRYPGLRTRILDEAESVARMLDGGERWWDPAWTEWTPEPTWTAPRLPPRWDDYAATTAR